MTVRAPWARAIGTSCFVGRETEAERKRHMAQIVQLLSWARVWSQAVQRVEFPPLLLVFPMPLSRHRPSYISELQSWDSWGPLSRARHTDTQDSFAGRQGGRRRDSKGLHGRYTVTACVASARLPESWHRPVENTSQPGPWAKLMSAQDPQTSFLHPAPPRQSKNTDLGVRRTPGRALVWLLSTFG